LGSGEECALPQGAGFPFDKLKTGSLTTSDWNKVIDFAIEQGVLGICFEGVERLPKGQQPDLDSLMEWYGQVEMQKAEYGQYVEAIASLAKEYSGSGPSTGSGEPIDTMLLKGYGLSLNWPVPEHRPVGDIDTYHFGRWREADELIKGKGIGIDYSHHHHSVFEWRGFAVENHYDIVNRYASVSGRREDDLLKELASRECRVVDVDGAKVLLPSATFNGIFLLTHAASHFAGDHITLRHLLDWAFFVDKEWQEIDWDLVVSWARKLGLLRFLGCLNGLCVGQLGLEAGKYPSMERDVALEQRVMEDILQPTFSKKGSGFVFKLRRLRANRWKRDLVAAEPFVPRMVRLAWSHLRGPKILKVNN